MQLEINRQTLEAEKLVGGAEAQRLVHAETLVPGAGREEVEILLTDAEFLPGNTDVQTDRVVTDGRIKCQAAYRLSGESIVKPLSVLAPFNMAFDVRGAAAGMIVKTGVTVDEIRAKYENGHMVFDAAITAKVRVTELRAVEAITGLSGALAETQFTEIVSHKVSAENGAVALVSDNVSLPAQLDARLALMEWATVTDVDVRKDLGGVRVTGSVQCTALISSGAKAHPVAMVRYAMPLNQLVQLPEWLSDDVRAAAAVRSVHAEVEQAPGGEDSTLKLEAEVEVSVKAIGTDRLNALTDIYSLGETGLTGKRQTVELCAGIRELCAQEPFRGTIMMPGGAGTVSSVCAAHARAAVGEVEPEDGQTRVAGVVEAQVLYMSGGSEKLMSSTAEIPFELKLAAELSDNDWVRVNVLSAEGSALMSDRIELKCLLEVCAEKRESAAMEIVGEITEGEAAEKPKGILLIWPQAGDTAWSVGKKYRLPVSRILESTGGAAEDIAGKVIVLRA